MSTSLIAGELDDYEYTVPPIIPNFLLRDSVKPLVLAIREHKYYLSQKANHDVGWDFAEKDFIEKGYKDSFEYGFKNGCLLKPSPNINPELRSGGKCQDFIYYNLAQYEAMIRTVEEKVNRNGRSITVDQEFEQFCNNKEGSYWWSEGFREGFCGRTCPCHGCSISLPFLLNSEPSVVKREKLKKLRELVIA